MTEFRLANQALVELAQRDLTEFWGFLDFSGSPVDVRNRVLGFFPDLVTSYGDAAALLGADWYESLRDVPASAKSFRAVMAEPQPPAVSEVAVRWGLGPLFSSDPNPAQALADLGGALQRLILQAGRDTIWDSARTDPVRTGIARVPTGLTTCKWCVMLASRGAVYSSELAAGGEGNRYHAHCDCVPTVVRSESDYPAGYDPNYYLDLYADGEGVGRDIPPA